VDAAHELTAAARVAAEALDDGLDLLHQLVCERRRRGGLPRLALGLLLLQGGEPASCVRVGHLVAHQSLALWCWPFRNASSSVSFASATRWASSCTFTLSRHDFRMASSRPHTP